MNFPLYLRASACACASAIAFATASPFLFFYHIPSAHTLTANAYAQKSANEAGVVADHGRQDGGCNGG